MKDLSLSMVYCMMIDNQAPLYPLLHFNLDPRMHQFVALEYGKGHLGLHSSHHLTVGYIPACFNIS